MELIYTTDLCTGCNKCVRSCPVLTANIATQEGYVTVDPDKCIVCGECFDVCPHEARDYYDDTDRFFEDLASGKKISVILAPAFLANYPKEYQRVLGYLKSKGVSHICSVSFGADITTWGYLKYITEHKFFGGISQPCPAVVTYVEKYIPELIPRLMPVHMVIGESSQRGDELSEPGQPLRQRLARRRVGQPHMRVRGRRTEIPSRSQRHMRLFQRTLAERPRVQTGSRDAEIRVERAVRNHFERQADALQTTYDDAAAGEQLLSAFLAHRQRFGREAGERSMLGGRVRA